MKNKNEKIISPMSAVFGYTGFNMILVGFAMLLTLLTLIAYPEEITYAKYFIIPAIPSIIIGLCFFLPIYKKDKIDLERKHDYLIVFLSWIVAILICSLPYLLTGDYSFTESMFESTSGLTTTGLTVMNPDTLPKIFLMFRSITLYVGGIGIILIMTSLFASSFGIRLYNAEGHQNNLIPNVIMSARIIVLIYTGYILMGIILYVLFGMPAFDAINHSIAAVANGGFSTRSASIGYYNSVPIEIISMVLMILGGTNFLLNLMIIRGKFKPFLKHCENRVSIILWIIFVPILSFVLLGSLCATFGESFRVALFQIVSAMATAGFQTVETFEVWPAAALLILSMFMIIGFQAGSTAGGIKEYRIAIAAKSIYYDIKSKLSKKREIFPKKVNIYGEDKDLTDDRVTEAHNFAVVYIVIIFIGTLIYTLCGHSVEKSLFEFSSILGCVGLSAGITGMGASNFVNWVAIIGMIIGRLDIYPIFLIGLATLQDIGKAQKNISKKIMQKGNKKNV